MKNFIASFENNNFPQNICGEANLLIDAFKKVLDDRHQFSHGTARLNTSEKSVEMRRFNPIKGNPYNVKLTVYDLNTMEENVRTFNQICESIILLIRDIDNYLELGVRKYLEATSS